MTEGRQRADGYVNPRTAYWLAEFVFGQLARTATVFLRHDFGERYFNISDFLGSSFTFLLYAGGVMIAITDYSERTSRTIAATAEQVAKNAEAFALWMFLFCFILTCIMHQIIAWQTKKTRPHWHSRYSGTSHLSEILPTAVHNLIAAQIAPFLGISERYLIQRFVEPLLVISTGFVTAFTLNPTLGAWFMLAGISLAVVEWTENTRAKNRLLDAIDAQIEAHNMNAAMHGSAQTDGSRTHGFVLPVPPNLSPQVRTAMAQAMTKLDPALEAILDKI